MPNALSFPTDECAARFLSLSLESTVGKLLSELDPGRISIGRPNAHSIFKVERAVLFTLRARRGRTKIQIF